MDFYMKSKPSVNSFRTFQVVAQAHLTWTMDCNKEGTSHYPIRPLSSKFMAKGALFLFFYKTPEKRRLNVNKER